MIQFLCIGIFIMLGKSRLNYLALPKLPITIAPPPPDLTIIIPARNEAHQIARAISSFPHLPVIVVNDASTDQTASAALAAGAKVINAPPLPPNAKGKPNACAAGAAIATTKWLLFVDADTWFEPAFPASLVTYAEANNLQMATAFLEQQCVSIAEKTLLPYAFALYFTGVSARSVNSQGSGTPLANGQCLLFLRSAYEQIGGHTAVIESVIEDVAIAELAKKYNLTLRVLRAEHLGHVRMYDSAVAIWRGFQKNSFRFLQINPLGGLQVVFSSILLTSWAPLLILGPHDYPTLLLFLTPFLTLLPWYANWSVLLAPCAIYFFQLIALNGMLATLTRRKTDWKGRGV